MSEADLKSRILAEIATHLSVYGRSEWDRIREHPSYSHLIGKEAGSAGKRKFYRWVEGVTGGLPAVNVGAGRPFEAGEAAVAALGDGKRRALLAAQKNIPAAPSPAYLMRKGAGAENSINFLAMVHRLLADGEKLRANAVKADENAADGSGEKITNPFVFNQSIAARLKVMDTALRVMQEIWDLQYQQRFYDAITSIIVDKLDAFPELQLEIIEELEKLNNRQGMTLHAEPG